MLVQTFDIVAAILFSIALSHTFLAKRFQYHARLYPKGSLRENFLLLLGEIELIFGIWATVLLGTMALLKGPHGAIDYLESCDFTEPCFVFVVLAICSSRPILDFAESLIRILAQLLPIRQPVAFFATTLVIGPLLGSLITEPAAMTVTAFILLKRFYQHSISSKLMYSTLGVLFVNISIGGMLTPYAAPPVLMVASKWNWGFREVLTLFGWKSILTCLCSTTVLCFRYFKELSRIRVQFTKKNDQSPAWLQWLHLALLCAVISTAHYAKVFVGLFFLFLGIVTITKKHQEPIKLKEGLLVSLFLGGLIVLGKPQGFWLEPILTQLSSVRLFLGSIGLTAFVDNAALTFLGSLVPSLSDASKYALVSGSVVGGGLTIIANAPNPAGYEILKSSFGEDGIQPLDLLRSALIPTLIASFFFWFL